MAKKRSVGIGLVGLGFMGLTHLRAARGLRGGKVVAISTSDPKKARGDFSSVGGNFGDGGSKENMKGIAVHPSLDALIEDDNVDLVDICLPSYLHADAAIRCLQAGKAVLVEKPVALDPADARKMLRAAKKSRKQLMVAQVLRFMPEFSLLTDAVKKKRWGKLLALHMRRIIAMPDWGDSSWFSDPKKSGGMVIDLHIHDTDFIVHLAGKPAAVSSTGLVDKKGVNFIRTTYHPRAKGPLLSSEGGWLNAPGLGFEHGYDAYFEKGTVHFNSSTAPQPLLYTTAGRDARKLVIKPVDGFARELQTAVNSVKSGKTDPLLQAAGAADSLAVCKAEERSVRSGGRKVNLGS